MSERRRGCFLYSGGNVEKKGRGGGRGKGRNVNWRMSTARIVFLVLSQHLLLHTVMQGCFRCHINGDRTENAKRRKTFRNEVEETTLCAYVRGGEGIVVEFSPNRSLGLGLGIGLGLNSALA